MGFFEILLILVVTLLVVGPERMPETVRSIILTIGRFKRAFANTKAEVEKQLGADEVRRQLHNEAVMESLQKMEDNVNNIADFSADKPLEKSAEKPSSSTTDSTPSAT